MSFGCPWHSPWVCFYFLHTGNGWGKARQALQSDQLYVCTQLEFMTKYLPGWGLSTLEQQNDSQCFVANSGNGKSTQVSQTAPLQDYGPHLDTASREWHLGSHLQKKWVMPVNNISGIRWFCWEQHVSHNLLLHQQGNCTAAAGADHGHHLFWKSSGSGLKFGWKHSKMHFSAMSFIGICWPPKYYMPER